MNSCHIASTSPGGRWGCGGPPTPVREHIGSITGQSSRLRGQGRVETVILVITMHMSVEWMSLALAPHRSRMDPTLGTFVHKSATKKVFKFAADNYRVVKAGNTGLPGDYSAEVHLAKGEPARPRSAAMHYCFHLQLSEQAWQLVSPPLWLVDHVMA